MKTNKNISIITGCGILIIVLILIVYNIRVTIKAKQVDALKASGIRDFKKKARFRVRARFRPLKFKVD